MTPGQDLSLSAKLLHEGSGYAVTKADIRCDGKLACNAEITFRLVEFPNPEFRASMEKMAAILEFPMGSAGPWLMRRAKPGSPASASCPASAKAPTRIGRLSRTDALNVDAETFAPYLVHPLAPLDLDKQIPKKGDQRQMEAWQRIGTYAAGLALADAGVKGNAELLAQHGHDRRRRRRRARHRGRRQYPHQQSARPPIPKPSSTNG